MCRDSLSHIHGAFTSQGIGCLFQHARGPAEGGTAWRAHHRSWACNPGVVGVVFCRHIIGLVSSRYAATKWDVLHVIYAVTTTRWQAAESIYIAGLQEQCLIHMNRCCVSRGSETPANMLCRRNADRSNEKKAARQAVSGVPLRTPHYPGTRSAGPLKGAYETDMQLCDQGVTRV